MGPFYAPCEVPVCTLEGDEGRVASIAFAFS
jgi:hypothetical protein